MLLGKSRGCTGAVQPAEPAAKPSIVDETTGAAEIQFLGAPFFVEPAIVAVTIALPDFAQRFVADIAHNHGSPPIHAAEDYIAVIQNVHLVVEQVTNPDRRTV